MDLKLGTDMRREDLNTEFKRHYVDDIKATVIAFANTQGGYLYVGIEDDGTACGVSDPDGAVLQIQNALRDSITPDVMACVNCRGEEIDGKDVVVVEVKQGSQRPYFLRGKGLRPEGVFVRQGPSTVPADVNAIREMLMETAGRVLRKRFPLSRSSPLITHRDTLLRPRLPSGISRKKRSVWLIKTGFTQILRCFYPISVRIP